MPCTDILWTSFHLLLTVTELWLGGSCQGGEKVGKIEKSRLHCLEKDVSAVSVGTLKVFSYGNIAALFNSLYHVYSISCLI